MKSPVDIDSKSLSSDLAVYVQLLCALYRDVASAYPAQHSTDIERDILTITRRVRKEGIGFLTKTLPSLGKDIDLSLSCGTCLRVSSFARKKGSELPRFLGWLIGMVFCASGEERLDADPHALKHLRTLLYLFYKLEVPHSDESVQRKLDEFVLTEEEIASTRKLSPSQGHYYRTAQKLVKRVLANANPRDIMPRHGPGAVATGERPSEKPAFRRFYPELNSQYPYDEYMYFNASHLSDCIDSNGLHGLETEGTGGLARVVLVPKDSRGPRIISMEPLEKQWIQQGQMALLYQCIEAHRLTRGHVNFRDQEVNRNVALQSSRTGRFVTIDMKEASDRVSLGHVDLLFPINWIEALHASRSSCTQLPDGRRIQLGKFAPMGSAVCFPVEALVFWSVSVSVLMRRMSLRNAINNVYVYGDDIAIPLKDYQEVVQTLEATGLRVNKSKCCVGPNFRESCGMDAYKGVCVTPLRLKKPWYHRMEVRSIISFVEFSNSLMSNGYESAALFVRQLINCKTRLTTGRGHSSPPRVPTIPLSKTQLGQGQVAFVWEDGLVSPDVLGYVRPRARFCKREHVVKYQVWAPRALVEKSLCSGYQILLDWWTNNKRDDSSVRPDYLRWSHIGSVGKIPPDQYPIRRRVTPQRRWSRV